MFRFSQISACMKSTSIWDVIHCMLCTQTLHSQHFVLVECGHAFCQQCLRKHVRDEPNKVTCPVCNAVTHVARINDIPTEFPRVVHRKVLSAADHIVNWSIKRDNIRGNGPKLQCACVGGGQCQYMCHDCGTAVCQRCWKKCHSQHSGEPLDTTVARLRDTLPQDLQPALCVQNTLKAQLEQFWERQERELERALKDVNTHSARLMRQLQERAQELCEELQQRHAQKRTFYERQKADADRRSNQLRQFQTLVSKLAASDQWLKLLLNGLDVQQRIERLSRTESSEETIRVLCHTHHLKAKQSFLLGDIEEAVLDPPPTPPSPPSPPPSSGMDNPPQAQPRLRTPLLSWSVKPCGQPSGVTFVSATQLAIADRKVVSLYDRPLPGSCLALPIRALSGDLSRRQARGLATTQSNHLAVTHGDCSGLYSLDGELRTLLGDQTSFHSACGVAVAPDGHIAIVDCLKCGISVFKPDGRRHLYIDGTTAGLVAPSFIAIDAHRRMIISESHCVKIFSPDGVQLSEFAQHSQPKGVCVAPGGNILLANCAMRAVSLYDAEGRHIEEVMTSRQHAFSWPHALAISPNAQLALTQLDSKHTLVFNLYDMQ